MKLTDLQILALANQPILKSGPLRGLTDISDESEVILRLAQVLVEEKKSPDFATVEGRVSEIANMLGIKELVFCKTEQLDPASGVSQQQQVGWKQFEPENSWRNRVSSLRSEQQQKRDALKQNPDPLCRPKIPPTVFGNSYTAAIWEITVPPKGYGEITITTNAPDTARELKKLLETAEFPNGFKVEPTIKDNILTIPRTITRLGEMPVAVLDFLAGARAGSRFQISNACYKGAMGACQDVIYRGYTQQYKRLMTSLNNVGIKPEEIESIENPPIIKISRTEIRYGTPPKTEELGDYVDSILKSYTKLTASSVTSGRNPGS